MIDNLIAELTRTPFGPIRHLHDVEFVVEGIEANKPSTFVREVLPGEKKYVNYVEIVRGRGTTKEMALSHLIENLKRILTYGKQVYEVTSVINRRCAGLRCIEAYVGAPIDPAMLRLAVFRGVDYIDPSTCGAGLEWIAQCEVGLDVMRRKA